MPRNLVLFDLEWNIGYQPYTFNYHGVQQTFRGEIVEIGAVKIDEDANVLDTFSIHLRPRIFRKLQHHIAKVTGLTQANLDKGEPIVQGLRRFMQWCGPDAEFAGVGVAMQNAEPPVKDCADYVTEADNNHDGVAEAVEKFILE